MTGTTKDTGLLKRRLLTMYLNIMLRGRDGRLFL